MQPTKSVLDISPVVNSCKLQQQHWRGIRASIYLRYKQENTSRNWNRFLHMLSMDGPTFFDVPLMLFGFFPIKVLLPERRKA